MIAKAALLVQQMNEFVNEIKSLENDELIGLRKQLHAVEKAIATLEKSGYPVPNDLKEAQEWLISAIEDQDEASVILAYLRDELRKISEKIKLADSSKRSTRAIQVKVLQTTIRTDGKNVVSRTLLRENLIATLKDLGGSASKKQVEREMERRLQGKLTDADYELVGVGIERWRENTQWLRYKLVQEGIMKSNSPRGVWELK